METLSSHFERWINVYKRNIVSPITFEKYKMSLQRLQEFDVLDDIKKYTRIEYQKLINQYAQTRSIQTVKDFNGHIRSCIRDLIDDEIIERDFTSKVKITGNPPPKRNKFLEENEIKKLVNILKLNDTELDWDKFIYLLLVTGVRFSEGLGLTPEDFNFNDMTISINKTYDYKLNSKSTVNVDTSTFNKTKTLSSIRTIKIDFRTAYIFKDIIEKAPKGFAIWPHWWLEKKQGAVFNSTVNDILKRLCKKAGIKPISLHGLRHTHASWLVANKVDMQAVSKRLGHSKLSITQDVYTHLMGTADQKANAQINALISGI